ERTNFAKQLGDVLDARDLSPALVHLDLDVLDDSLGRVNGYAAPRGLYEDDLLECLSILPKKVTPAAFTVASFDPRFEGGDKVALLAVDAIKGFVKSLIETGALTKKTQDQ
ncbi:hypothetical protein B0O99DRAFT_508324, partial [Bisporella sp. PMI_857]